MFLLEIHYDQFQLILGVVIEHFVQAIKNPSLDFLPIKGKFDILNRNDCHKFSCHMLVLGPHIDIL